MLSTGLATKLELILCAGENKYVRTSYLKYIDLPLIREDALLVHSLVLVSASEGFL